MNEKAENVKTAAVEAAGEIYVLEARIAELNSLLDTCAADKEQQIAALQAEIAELKAALEECQNGKPTEPPVEPPKERKGIIYFSGGETGAIQVDSAGEDGWKYVTIGDANYLGEAANVVSAGQVIGDIPEGAPMPLAGDKCIRMYYKKGWPGRGTTADVRSELNKPGLLNLELNTEYWIGFAIYLHDNANNRELIKSPLQNCRCVSFHHVGASGGPGFHLSNGQWRIEFGPYADQDIGPVVLGQWNRFVIHTNMATNSSGFAKIWLNANSESDPPDYHKTGAFKYAHNPRIGLYRGQSGANGGWYGATYAEHFYDDYRIGDATSGFNSVNP